MLLVVGILVPFALIAWAQATAGVVRISPVLSLEFGLTVAAIGATILLAGILGRAVFRLLPHPVHTGFCMTCFGVSMAVGSASGLWLVSPMVTLGCIALIFGRPQRAGATPARLIPQSGDLPPTAHDRATCYLFLLAPWLLLYEAVLAIGIPPDAVSGVSRFEQQLPVIEWTQIFYGSTYLLALSVPLFAKTRSDLRRFSVRGLWTMAVAYPLFLTVPLIAPKRPFTPHSLPGRLLLWERAQDSSVAAFPSFHVIWSILAAQAYASRWPKLKWVFYGWAASVAASCVTTSQHSILDVLGGAATVALVARGPRLWEAARRFARTYGQGRVGLYEGASVFLAVSLAATMAGPRLFGLSGWLILAAIAAADAWTRLMFSFRSATISWPATQSYSVFFDAFAALTVTRLWILAAPLYMIAGLYLILSGFARFAETARASAVMVIAGLLITTLGHSALAPAPQFTAAELLPTAVLGLAVTLIRNLVRDEGYLVTP